MPCGACRERLAKERLREVTLDPDHSVPFNVHAWSDSESVIELVDTLYASLLQKTLTSLVGTSNNTGSMSIKDIMRVVLVDQGAVRQTSSSISIHLMSISIRSLRSATRREQRHGLA